MLDERAKRRDDFVEGVPVKLEDGQEWTFPKPRIQLRLTVSGDGAYSGMTRDGSAETNRRFGDRYWKLSDAVTEALSNEDDPTDMYNSWGAIAADLLGRNYDLTLDEMADLLVIVPRDDANVAMWTKIVQTALGIAPKNAGDGSGSPPS